MKAKRFVPVYLLVFALSCLGMDVPLIKGAFIAKATYLTTRASKFSNEREEAEDLFLFEEDARYSGAHSRLELIYGLSRKATLVFKVDYEERRLKSESHLLLNSGVSSEYLGVKRWLRWPGVRHPLITEVGFWKREGEHGDMLPLSSGSSDWQIRVGHLQFFSNQKERVMVEMGYRWRGGLPSDEFFMNTDLELDVWHFFSFQLAYGFLESSGQKRQPSSPLTFADERARQVLGGFIIRPLSKNTNVEIGYEKVLRAKSAYRTSSWRLSVSWRS